MASTYLTRNAGTPTSGQIMTISLWAKRSSTVEHGGLFSGQTSNGRSFIKFTSGDNIEVRENIGATQYFKLTTNAKYRDCNGWYHIVLTIDTTQGTASDRLKLYVNGVQVTSFSTAAYPTQNLILNGWNKSGMAQVVGNEYSYSYFFNGIISHIHFIDGTAYDPTSFGEYDANGVWKIKTDVSVTYGTNGFLILKDGNSVTDQSGNSNNFTVGGGTLTKTEDNPSNVFATINPLVRTVSTPSFNAGNNTVSSSAGAYQNHFSTIGMTGSGKYYWEMKVNGTANSAMFFGISSDIEMNNLITVSNVVGSTSTGYSLVASSGNKYNNENSTSYGSALTNGEIMMGALDLDNGKIWYGKNGTWFNSGNPASGSNEAFSGISASNVYFVSGTVYDGGYGSVNYNFGNGYFETTAVASAGTNASGNGIFEYDVPTGYTALSTKGLNL